MANPTIQLNGHLATAALAIALAIAMPGLTAHAAKASSQKDAGARDTAQSTPAPAHGAVLAAIRRMAPQAPAPNSIGPSPIAGFLEVRIASQLLYVREDGGLLIEGNVVDTNTRANLTQAALNKALAIDFDKLPLKDAIVTYKQGKGERKLAVFADPHCGFCKRFEPELEKLENVTVYTFMIPVLGPRSDETVKRIACAADPGKAWDDWMLRNVEPPVAPDSCAPQTLAAAERNKAFARLNSINSTPTTFAPAKARAPGAIPAEQLTALLDQQGPQKDKAAK